MCTPSQGSYLVADYALVAEDKRATFGLILLHFAHIPEVIVYAMCNECQFVRIRTAVLTSFPGDMV